MQVLWNIYKEKVRGSMSFRMWNDILAWNRSPTGQFWNLQKFLKWHLSKWTNVKRAEVVTSKCFTDKSGWEDAKNKNTRLYSWQELCQELWPQWALPTLSLLQLGSTQVYLDRQEEKCIHRGEGKAMDTPWIHHGEGQAGTGASTSHPQVSPDPKLLPEGDKSSISSLWLPGQHTLVLLV